MECPQCGYEKYKPGESHWHAGRESTKLKCFGPKRLARLALKANGLSDGAVKALGAALAGDPNVKVVVGVKGLVDADGSKVPAVRVTAEKTPAQSTPPRDETLAAAVSRLMTRVRRKKSAARARAQTPKTRTPLRRASKRRSGRK